MINENLLLLLRSMDMKIVACLFLSLRGTDVLACLGFELERQMGLFLFLKYNIPPTDGRPFPA